MRVLEITASAGFGGGPQHVYELARLLREKVIIDVACPRQEPFWDRYSEIARGRLIEIPERKFRVLAALRVAQHVLRHQVDLIHSHGKGAGLYGRLVRLLTGVPLVHTHHGIHIDQYGKITKRLYIAYERISGRLDAMTIFVSDSEMGKAKSKRLFAEDRAQKIPNGVRCWNEQTAADWRTGVRRALSVSSEEVVAIVIGRFTYEKNLHEVVTIADGCPDVTFWIIGGGKQWDEIRAACEQRKLQNIWMPGFLPDPLKYIAAADIVLSTSRWEGMPLSILEGMSLGKPVIASDVVGNKDLVQNDITGYLYPLGKIDFAIDRITAVAADRALRLRLGSAAKEIQNLHFSALKMANATLSVYSKVGNASQRDV